MALLRTVVRDECGRVLETQILARPRRIIGKDIYLRGRAGTRNVSDRRPIVVRAAGAVNGVCLTVAYVVAAPHMHADGFPLPDPSCNILILRVRLVLERKLTSNRGGNALKVLLALPVPVEIHVPAKTQDVRIEVKVSLLDDKVVTQGTNARKSLGNACQDTA